MRNSLSEHSFVCWRPSSELGHLLINPFMDDVALAGPHTWLLHQHQSEKSRSEGYIGFQALPETRMWITVAVGCAMHEGCVRSSAESVPKSYGGEESACCQAISWRWGLQVDLRRRSSFEFELCTSCFSLR